MVASFTLGLALLPLLIGAYETDPPTTASPDTISDCTWWQVATETDTCAGISEYWDITEVQFKTYVRLKPSKTHSSHANSSNRTQV